MPNRRYVLFVQDVIKVYSHKRLCPFRYMKVYNVVYVTGGKIQLNDLVYFLYSINMQYTERITSAKWNGVKGFCIFDKYLYT